MWSNALWQDRHRPEVRGCGLCLACRMGYNPMLCEFGAGNHPSQRKEQPKPKPTKKRLPHSEGK